MSVAVRCGDRFEIAKFISETVGDDWPLPTAFEALGAYDGERLLGGFLYLNYLPLAEGLHSINMHMAGSPGWLTRRTLRAFFAYPFHQLRCSRVVGNIRANRTAARSVAERMGCKLDGTIRSGISEDFDTCVYTMTRQECPWI